MVYRMIMMTSAASSKFLSVLSNVLPDSSVLISVSVLLAEPVTVSTFPVSTPLWRDVKPAFKHSAICKAFVSQP